MVVAGAGILRNAWQRAVVAERQKMVTSRKADCHARRRLAFICCRLTGFTQDSPKRFDMSRTLLMRGANGVPSRWRSDVRCCQSLTKMHAFLMCNAYIIILSNLFHECRNFIVENTDQEVGTGPTSPVRHPSCRIIE